MQNAVTIFHDNDLVTTIVIHQTEFLSLSEILDRYAEFGGFERKKLTGCFTNVIDITDCSNGHAPLVGYAKNPWK